MPQFSATNGVNIGERSAGLGNPCSIQLSYGATASFPRFPPLAGQLATAQTRKGGMGMSAHQGAHSVPASFDGDDNRRRYFEPQVQRRESYTGPLTSMEADEVRALLEEAIDWGTACCPIKHPLPPAGLPGKTYASYDRYEPAGELIRIGMGYVRATVKGEGRAMHNRWEAARSFIDKLVRDTEERVRDEILQKEIARQMQREIEIQPQSVYFIGAADGPIKIGISVNPLSRLASLQTSHHDKLAILATCDGGAERERNYHKRFADCRLSGEWFERTPAILAEIASLNQGASQ